MAKWWPELEADSYGDMYARQMFAAESRSGTSPTPSGDLPSLTNDDVLILVEYWAAQAKRNKTPWPGWYPLSLLALGYRKKGDKFRVDKRHARAWLPSEDLPTVWETELLPIANRIDAEQTDTPLPPSKFKPSKRTLARFRRVARAAWERLRRERDKPIPRPPLPPRLPQPDLSRLLFWGAVIYFGFLRDK